MYSITLTLKVVHIKLITEKYECNLQLHLYKLLYLYMRIKIKQITQYLHCKVLTDIIGYFENYAGAFFEIRVCSHQGTANTQEVFHDLC